MSNRAWFYASEGQQHGPYPEVELREFIARGTVTADMLVWTEGMVNWQKAAEIPGLISNNPVLGEPGPLAIPQSGGPLTSGNIAVQSFSADFGIWPLLGRSLLYGIGSLLVIPAPWLATGFYRWFITHLRVPQWPNLGFAGQPGDIWYAFVLLALCSLTGFSNVLYLSFLAIPLQAFLSWMIFRWIVANVSSQGRPLSLTFMGDAWTFIGWYVVFCLSGITIVFWAWVGARWMRWMCRHIAGTSQEVVFNASGWQVLWRSVVFCLVSILIIPIPWALGWYVRWFVSEFALVERA